MIKQANNGYEVQISEISPKYWTVSCNKDAETLTDGPYITNYPVATLPLYNFRIDYTVSAHESTHYCWDILELKSFYPYLTQKEYIDWFNEKIKSSKEKYKSSKEKYDANDVFVSIQNVTTLITEGKGDE